MRIFEGLTEKMPIKNAVVTIGTFDGVHIGHQEILKTLIAEAVKCEGESVLLTFYPHPRMVLFPEQTDLQLLQTQTEKLEKLASIGLQNVVIYPFSKEFADLSAERFVEEILIKGLQAKMVIIGYDHQFGHNREGNLAFLKQYAEKGFFELMEIPAEQIDEANISSSKIRKAILGGEISTANSFLGSPFELSGTIVKGLQNGRKIGFPTANIRIDDQQKIIPATGVYAVEMNVAGTSCRGMMNVGWRPTIEEEKLERKIEVHLFDFQKEIYDEACQIRVLQFVRAEHKFPNLEALKVQIQRDEETVRAYFSTAQFS
jgi:riboflavin kinase / FMN adenylyltransferase